MIPRRQMTIEESRNAFACHYCEAETADDCICDDLNFADGEHISIGGEIYVRERNRDDQ